MDDIRKFLLDNVSATGGHLASNLGVVELTKAIHNVYDPYNDRIVFDVGHQSYVHKYLTERKSQFITLRKLGGMSGFPKPSESDADAFIAGHASNSISVTLGMAVARTLQGENYDVVCVIGDGALTGGLAYEGLCNAGQSGERMVVILNDNEMSIAPNVGAIARLLKRLAERPSYYEFKRNYRRFLSRFTIGRKFYSFTHAVKTRMKRLLVSSGVNMFEDLGFRYFGPVDGHNIEKTEFLLNEAKRHEGPALVHVLTVKGKGYTHAENNPGLYHGVPPFNPDIPLIPSKTPSYSTVFGDELIKLAERNHKICAITAAMPVGTGLSVFVKRFPDRFFDEGITEAHSLTFAAGMAKQGLRPVYAVYSSFLQRAFDSLIHDVCILSLPVIIGIDRAGLVGEDGETHHGIFDLSMLMSAPNVEVYCPSTFDELRLALIEALKQDSHPVAIRYPRGGAELQPFELNSGSEITLVSYGIMSLNCMLAINKSSLKVDFIKLFKVKPLNIDNIVKSVLQTGKLAIIEDVIESGSVSQYILAELTKLSITPKKVLIRNCGSGFITHGKVDELWKLLRLDSDSISEDLQILSENRTI